MTSKIVPREPTQEMLDAGFGPLLETDQLTRMSILLTNEPCDPTG